MRRYVMPWLAAALILGAAPPATAQVRTIDPDKAIDSDLSGPPPQPQQTTPAPDATPPDNYQNDAVPADDAPPPTDQPRQDDRYTPPPPQDAQAQPQADERTRDATTESADTYSRDDLMSAGEGVFGKGAEGLAGIIEKILKDQGRPNGYIAGREASGAFVLGLRYGSGILTSKIEGQQPIYWTGPSVGFDVGGDANKVFVLVYNLYDTADLYKRFPAGEGHLYFVGGFSASYLRRGNIVLIPVRLGVGWRAGVNVGYMKFTHKSKWLPF